MANNEIAKIQEIRKSKQIISLVPRQALSKVEQKLYWVTLYKFGKKFWDFDKNELIVQDEYPFEFTPQEFLDLMNMSKQQFSAVAEKSFENIAGLAYKSNELGWRLWYPVFQEIGYDTVEFKVRGSFNKAFVNHVIDVKKDFVKLSLEQVHGFKSRFTVPIYDLIKANSSPDNFINVDIEISLIRRHLHMEKTYLNFKDFNRRVLQPVFKDLEGSDLKLKITKLHQDRKVHALNFKGHVVIEDKKSPEEIHPNQITMSEALSDSDAPEENTNWKVVE